MKYRVYASNGTRLIVSLIAGLVCFIQGLVAIFLIDKKHGASGIGIVFIVIGSIFLVYVIIELLKKNKNKKKYEAQKANQLVRGKAYPNTINNSNEYTAQPALYTPIEMKKVMYCSNCGTKLAGTNKFCSKCGTKIF